MMEMMAMVLTMTKIKQILIIMMITSVSNDRFVMQSAFY